MSIQKLAILVVMISLCSVLLSVYLVLHLTKLGSLIGDRILGNDNQSKKLGVHFLNIGQGDAIYIHAPNQNTFLIDSGPQNEKVLSEIYKFKSFFDRYIHTLLITHADADHIGSMKKVIKTFGHQIFLSSGLKTDTALFVDLMQSANMIDTVDLDDSDGTHTRSKNILLTVGMTIVLDKQKDIKFEVLFPDFEYHINQYNDCAKTKHKNKRDRNNVCLKYINSETNLNSIVGRLSYGSTSFMLTGDSPIEVERFLISKYSDSRKLESEVLKLGHHGSKTSTSPEFLAAVSPDFAVVSSGKGNRYGHPHKKVLDTITQYKKVPSRNVESRNVHSRNSELRMEIRNQIEILRTDVDGTISFYSDGSNVSVSR